MYVLDCTSFLDSKGPERSYRANLMSRSTKASELNAHGVCMRTCRVVSQPHEVPRHWVQLTLTWPTPGAAAAAIATSATRAALTQQLGRLVHVGQATLADGGATASSATATAAAGGTVRRLSTSAIGGQAPGKGRVCRASLCSAV